MTGSKEPRSLKEKAISLIDYLYAIVKLRSNPIYNVDTGMGKTFQEVLWLSDIPRWGNFFTRAWGWEQDIKSSYGPDDWIVVEKPKETELEIPDLCKKWVGEDCDLRNPDKPPKLLTKIRAQKQRSGRSDEYQYLKDFPKVEKRWENFIEKEWKPMAESFRAWDIYKRVYNLKNCKKLEDAGYKLVLGLGLLKWRQPPSVVNAASQEETPSSDQGEEKGNETGRDKDIVCCHTVVADVCIDFEATSGKITVKPHDNGAKLRVELDMLNQVPDDLERVDAVKDLSSIAKDNPWNKEAVENALKAVVNSIGSDGRYDSKFERSVDVTKTPVIEFAPALILRKRSEKELMGRLGQIKTQINGSEKIPNEFARLIVPAGELRDEAKAKDSLFDGEIFFPRHSNVEQRSIVEKMRISNGVLVQGPPGTGKSHTIANLMTHLLAEGQRILVTAKTAQALEVLVQGSAGKEPHLRKELRPLCICQLGSESTEQKILEDNVKTITIKKNYWIDDENDKEISRLGEELETLKAEKKQKDDNLREIRKSEMVKHNIAEGYTGTVVEIARMVERNRDANKWFTDTVPDAGCPFWPKHLLRIIQDLQYFSPEKRDELKLTWPKEEELPLQGEFASWLKAKKMAGERRPRSEVSADPRYVELLDKLESVAITDLYDKLSGFRENLKGLRGKAEAGAHHWPMSEILNGILLYGNRANLDDLLDETQNIVLSIGELAKTADSNELEYPEKFDISKLREVVYSHFQDDGKKSGLFGKLKEIALPVTLPANPIKINGHRAISTADRKLVLDVLYVRFKCERARDLWAEIGGRIEESSFVRQVKTIESMCESLKESLTLEVSVRDCRDAIQKYCPSIKPVWTDDKQIEELINSCRSTLARIGKSDATIKIRNLENRVSAVVAGENPHPVSKDLSDAVKDRDPEKFDICVEKVRLLQETRQRFEIMEEDLNKLESLLPQFATLLKSTSEDPCWKERINGINETLEWAKARHWIEEHITGDDIPALAKESEEIQNTIYDCIAELAALKAWKSFLQRLKEEHIKSMKAYLELIRRIGKGKGKFADINRLKAQEYLNKCVEAFPVWVMPLEVVWNNITPKPEMFDVIIVDEASQCGLEAIPLFYMTKRIVIVGDDEQTSPENPGLSLDTASYWFNKYVADINFSDVKFHMDSSLFGIGSHSCSTTVSLREHFRCMPEIISFSEKLCYSEIGLTPLKQYGPDRLPPLVDVHVKNARREKDKNHEEADEIVETICCICKDKKYDGKTIGVISLHSGGGAQADLIKDKLLKKLGTKEMENRSLICANPKDFQGDERDIVLLSLVVASNEDKRHLPLANQRDRQRFNVAASRAREQMILFHSITAGEYRHKDCLRRDLLEFFEKGSNSQIDNFESRAITVRMKSMLDEKARNEANRQNRPPERFKNWFEVDVALELLNRKYTVIPQYTIAKNNFDLAIVGEKAIVAVECDGDQWEGADKYDKKIEHQRKLERCGWKIFRIRGSAFYADRERCLKPLLDMLKEMGIKPEN